MQKRRNGVFIPGMTSVTFRKKSINEIVDICKLAKLECLEWGGDVHIPPGSAVAAEARKICMDEGIRIFSYGSYFSLTGTDDYIGDFRKIADTCGDLGAKVVRIWATRGWRRDASQAEYDSFIEKMKTVSDIAAEYQLTVCFEHHQKTFCDCCCNAQNVLADISRPNIKTYWQPICDCFEDNLRSARALKDKTVCLHVYNWKGSERYLLSEGEKQWKEYLSVFKSEEKEIPCLLEFAKDDCETCFLADADCLRRMLSVS